MSKRCSRYWNGTRAHGIELFRITSDLIPFGSHSVNTVPWWRILEAQFARLGAFIRKKVYAFRCTRVSLPSSTHRGAK